MDREQMQELMRHQFGRCLDLNERKGSDYAGDDDALANFKSAARRLGLTPEQIWAVYADKHWSAIMAYCRDGEVKSEPIEGRIDDAITYLTLLRGLVEEKKPREQVTHGRHCPCSACARQDWSEPQLAPCGMHGPSCPPVYDPFPEQAIFGDGTASH